MTQAHEPRAEIHRRPPDSKAMLAAAVFAVVGSRKVLQDLSDEINVTVDITAATIDGSAAKTQSHKQPIRHSFKASRTT